MPFNNPSRDIEFAAAISSKQQTAFATALGDSDLDKVFTMDEIFNPALSRVARSDRQKFGRGTEFASPGGHATILKDAPLTMRGELNSFLAGYVGGFGLGKVVTSQPDAGGNPTVYRHTFTFFDPITAVTKQPPVTTIYQYLGSAAAFKTKLMGMAVNEWSISGERRGFLTYALSMIGRGERSQDPVTLGAATAGAYLDMGGMVFTIGAQGGASDLSDRLINFSVNGNNDLDAGNGYYPGSGQYRGRIWIGKNRRAGFSADVFLKEDNADILAAWDADTLWEAKFKVTGAVITGIYNHDIEIFFPSIRLTEVPIQSVDGKLAHRITVAEDQVYKDSGAGVQEPIRIVVTNTQATYLVAG